MKPVTVSIDLPQPRDEVFAFLDVMANHEPFTNHMLKDWEYAGPPSGVGSKAKVRVSAAGRTEVVDIEVIAAQAPAKIVEQNVGAKGRREATGTYILEVLPEGGTRVNFEYAWQQAPLAERLTAPLLRSFMRRSSTRSLERLRELLDGEPVGS